MRVNELWALNFSLIDGKHGWTRANVLGGEFNYSGRCVIILDTSLKIDEVAVPYKAFIEQYKGSIVKRVMRDKGWTTTKAANFVASKFTYDEYIYKIMCDIIREDQPKMILNRNPECILWGYLI